MEEKINEPENLEILSIKKSDLKFNDIKKFSDNVIAKKYRLNDGKLIEKNIIIENKDKIKKILSTLIKSKLLLHRHNDKLEGDISSSYKYNRYLSMFMNIMENVKVNRVTYSEKQNEDIIDSEIKKGLGNF